MSNSSDHSEEKKLIQSWAERRGRQSLHCNANLILIKAPLDAVADVLAENAIEVQRDVLNSEIEISGFFKFAYQLIGHSWSIIILDEATESHPRDAFSPLTEARISEVLQQPVIRLICGNVSDTISYSLFKNGKLSEHFYGELGEQPEKENSYGLETQRYIVFPHSENLDYTQTLDGWLNQPTALGNLDYWSSHPEFLEESFPGMDNLREQLLYESFNYAQTVHFWSSHRQFVESQFSNIWNFVEQFLVENDAFDPTIDSTYLLGESFLRCGDRCRVVNPGFISVTYDQSGERQEIVSIPDLVRIDYFRFGS